jgi:hypothetical protein
MKTTSSILAGAVAAVVIAASPLTFAQTASSAPENNKTDANESKGGMGDQTPRTDTSPVSNNKADQNTQRTSTVTDADKKQKEDNAVSKLDKKPAPSDNDKVAKNSYNDTSHQKTGEGDQTKAALSNKNAPGD